ncbi:bile acid:sodium symporter family protein [Ammoniphilus sp. YIM 78166]|uniref:bile acid:sodium symporter family protein n=1 Tax=Ammoniphilus sp. YIM 78166 TaxID=1644106 RepID=UPI001F0E6413|nr:bile acid:sodium symporter family protein [Ammoniphilus sp. YIM 78166]
MVRLITKFMPLWIVVCSVVAFWKPAWFQDLHGWTGPALGLVLFFMGLSLKTESIWQVIRNPRAMFIGILLKWTVTLGISILIAYVAFRDVPEMATGVILAGAVPSGTSANLYTFMANGAAALSIAMSAIDTFIGPFLTPLIVKVSAGTFVDVQFWPLFARMVLIVFLPICLGLLIQWKWGQHVERVRPWMPVLSALCLFTIVLAVVSNSQAMLAENIHLLPVLGVAVVIQVTAPMWLGYKLAQWFGLKEEECRAILFETGICNTALAALLALDHISAAAAVPAVANMVVNLSVGAYVALQLSKKSLATNLSDNLTIQSRQVK